MHKNIFWYGSRLGLLTVVLISALTLLTANFTEGEALASSIQTTPLNSESSVLQLQGADPFTGTSTAPAQQPLTSTSTITSAQAEPAVSPDSQGTDADAAAEPVGPVASYNSTFEALGFDETVLNSPFGNAQYSFRLPEDWLIQADGVLELDFSYSYAQVDSAAPPFLGNLTISFNDEILSVFQIDEQQIEQRRLSIPLPADVFRDQNDVQVIQLLLEAGLLCEVPHTASLLVHPTSSISLNYAEQPVVTDLANYPQPFYQRSIEPDSVRFVLPAQPTPNEASSAMAVAAKLGDLTGERLVISATTDVDLAPLLSPVSASLDEHLLVIGKPQSNALLPLLNDVADLPISLAQRQVDMVVQGPTMVAPGDTFTYGFTVTNTLDEAVNLSLINPLPRYTELVDCTANCNAGTSDGQTVTWSDLALAPDENLSFSLTLRATDVLTGDSLENTVTIVDSDLGAISGDTLISTVANTSSNSDLQFSETTQGGYFFINNGRAIAKEDGVVQLIPSPWDEGRAVLVITGLSDAAVSKAGQAMGSSEPRFPGIEGSVALIKDALPLSEIDEPNAVGVETTFEALGYGDQLLQGGAQQQVNYDLPIPFGRQLTDEAAVDLYFGHSQLIDYDEAGLTVLVNNQPAATVALSQETAGNGHIHLDLADANLQAQNNRLTVQVTLPVQSCGSLGVGAEQNWVVIKNSSKMFLPHREDMEARLDLEQFPSPFDANSAMTNLLFALPASPTVEDWENALNLAATLGDAAGGDALLPAIILGDEAPETGDLADYHIIVVGRPSLNNFLQGVNHLLPQPFLPGSDDIEQQLGDVIFRLPQGVDLGYVQLLTSPWNEERALLAVTGTSEQGVRWATQALTSRAGALKENLALIKENEINTIETRELIQGGMAVETTAVVPEMITTTATVSETAGITNTAVASTTPGSIVENRPDFIGAEPASSTTNRPAWLFPLVGINSLVVLGIFGLVIWQAQNKRKNLSS